MSLIRLIKIKVIRIILYWMYTYPKNRSSSNLYEVKYTESPFHINRTYQPYHSHRRQKTEQHKRQQILQKELWSLEKRELEDELETERNSHRKSMKMIQELIQDNRKYYQKNSEKKYYQPIQSFLTHRKTQKEFEKPNNITTPTKESALQKFVQTYQNPQNTSNQKTKLKSETEQRITIKDTILKKLNDTNKNELKIKKSNLDSEQKEESPKNNHEQGERDQEISFLKKELMAKNAELVELQCEIIKLRGKVKNYDERKDLSHENDPSDVKEQLIKSRRKQFCLEKQCLNQIFFPRVKSKILQNSDVYSVQFSQKYQKKTQDQQKQQKDSLRKKEGIFEAKSTQYPESKEEVCDIGVQTKQKKIRDQSTSSDEIILEFRVKEEGKPAQLKDENTQTSENIYDYIEETYLEWIFDKDFKQMQAKNSLKEKS